MQLRLLTTSQEERKLYCQYWRKKLLGKKKLEFPAMLCPAIAEITKGFSFAYMQEAFVATLLALARDHTASLATDTNRWGCEPIHVGLERSDDDLDSFVLWRVIKVQIRVLREDMDNSSSAQIKLAGMSQQGAKAAREDSYASRTALATMTGWNGNILRDTEGGRHAWPWSHKAEAVVAAFSVQHDVAIPFEAPLRGTIRASIPTAF